MIDLTFPFLPTKNVSHIWSFFSLPEETKCKLSKNTGTDAFYIVAILFDDKEK